MGESRLIFYEDSKGNNPVRDFMDSLPDKANSKVTRAIAPLHEFGVGSHIKETKKLTGTKLWEIRILGRDNIRVFYTAIIGRRVLLLHGFVKKTNKTPKKEIVIAERRRIDWIERNILGPS